MSGVRYPHNWAKDNLATAINTALKDSPCYALTSDMRVKVSPTGLYTYPDIVVVCGEPELEDANGDTLLNPVVVVEILSETTANYDRGAKFRHYQRIATLREYLLVAQDEPLVERFVRGPAGTWVLHTAVGLDSQLVLDAVPVRVPLADIYAGVTFPEPRLR